MITINQFKDYDMKTEVTERSGGWRTMNIALWVAQIILAGIFSVVGFIKMSTPMVNLARRVPWIAEFSGTTVFLIGCAETAASLGLILPSMLKFMPKLTVLASYCLCIMMIVAAGFHIAKTAYAVSILNFILAALAYFIAWGRSKKAVIEHSIY
ncbi:MAG TPA: DoxX family protein [Chryseosolibacter sp.]|nr:DoxX family protein [Chryseosolibacter sp.]